MELEDFFKELFGFRYCIYCHKKITKPHWKRHLNSKFHHKKEKLLNSMYAEFEHFQNGRNI
jgi:hypothetical protein